MKRGAGVNIPNMLTIIRLILVPVFLIVFFSQISGATIIAILVFLAAGLTDVLDGFLARKYNMITKWGSILDPLADKLMSITVLVSLTAKNLMPVWVLYVIGIKEVMMITGGIMLFKKGTYVPAQAYGKISTVLLYISIITLEFVYRPIGLVLLYGTALTALFALYKYFENFIRINKKQYS